MYLKDNKTIFYKHNFLRILNAQINSVSFIKKFKHSVKGNKYRFNINMRLLSRLLPSV